MPVDVDGPELRGRPWVSRQLAGTAMEQLVRRNLRGIWVRGELPAGAAVWVSNHHSWWDYFVAADTLRAVGRRDHYVLVHPESFGSERLFRAAGAIPTTEVRQALAALMTGAVLVVFVEGQLRPAGPVASIRPGATWLARRSGAPVVTVATRVVLRGHQAPEAYLDVAPPDAVTGRADLSELVDMLDREIHACHPERPVPGFRRAVRGVRSWHERFGGAMVAT